MLRLLGVRADSGGELRHVSVLPLGNDLVDRCEGENGDNLDHTSTDADLLRIRLNTAPRSRRGVNVDRVFCGGGVIPAQRGAHQAPVPGRIIVKFSDAWLSFFNVTDSGAGSGVPPPGPAAARFGTAVTFIRGQ